MPRPRKEETREYIEQAEELTRTDQTNDVMLDKKQPTTKEKSIEDVSTDQLIAVNTELWYKAQVLDLLAEITQRLRNEDKK